MADSPAPPKNEPSAGAGRLFVVPLLIVLVVIGCAVVVVLGFGAIVSFKEVPVRELLSRLESASGDRSAGVLMPRDKELWQAGQELAFRLDNIESEIAGDELPEVRSRLAALLNDNLNSLDSQEKTVRQVVYFTMHAAAKSGSTAALPMLMECALSERNEVQREALRALAWMSEVPEARSQANRLVPLLKDDSDVVRIFACLVLANLSSAEDDAVREALLRATRRLDDSPEVRWNALLALARFGFSDSEGWIAEQTSELLERDFWARRRVQYTPENGGPAAQVDRPFSDPEIETRLIAAIGAAEHLSDENVWARIEVLSRDPSLKVANRALQAEAERGGS